MFIFKRERECKESFSFFYFAKPKIVCIFAPTVSTTLPDENPANQGGTFVFFGDMRQYDKQPISIEEQIAQLKYRGLIIDNEVYAKRILSIISYFRLAGYLRPMESDKKLHIFKEGKLFSNAVDIYYFDKDLRAIIFDAIQTIEIAIRTRMIQKFSMKHGPFWFMNPSLFKNDKMYQKCLDSIETDFNRSKEDFIEEHRQKYDYPKMPPAWKTLEIVSFGTLCKLYCNFNDNSTKKAIAREFNIPQHEYLESWMLSLVALRNCCAHHSRVWNRTYPMKPKLPKSKIMRWKWIDISDVEPSRLYILLCCILYWTDNISPDSSIRTNIIHLLKNNKNIDPSAMGFPANWKEEPLWKD